MSCNDVLGPVPGDHHIDFSGVIKPAAVEIEIADRAHSLLNTPPPEDFDMRSFALMHCGSILKGTDWEGHSPLPVFSHYKQLFSLGDFNHYGLSSAEQLDALQGTLKQLTETHKLIKTSDFLALIDFIKRSCPTPDTCCYIPTGWIHKESGHYCSLKFRLLPDGQFAVSILNYGAGMQYHNPLVSSTHKVKYDYQSEEYVINLDMPLGQQFIQRMILLQTDMTLFDETGETTSHLATTQQYDETDLYGLLQLSTLDKPLSYHDRDKLLHAVTPQRIGNCPIANTYAALRDVLVENITNPLELKRFHHFLKQISLIEGFKYVSNLKEDPKKGEYIIFLTDALNEHFIRLDKLYPEILSPEEHAIGLAIAREIQAFIDKAMEEDQRTIFDVFKNQTPPEYLSALVPFEERTPLPEITAELVTTEEAPEDPAVDVVIPPAITPPPENLHPHLETFKTALEALPNNTQTLVSALNFMRHIPLSSGDPTDSYWDNVPQEDIKSVMTLLSEINNKIASINLETEISSESNVYKCEIVLRTYDIMAQIATRIPELRLGDQYTLALDDVYQYEYFFQDPTSYATVKHIMDNFKRRSTEKKRIFSHIIPYAPIPISFLPEDHTYSYFTDTVMSDYYTKIQVNKALKGKFFPCEYSDTERFIDVMTCKGNLQALDPAFSILRNTSALVHNLVKKPEESYYFKAAHSDHSYYAKKRKPSFLISANSYLLNFLDFWSLSGECRGDLHFPAGTVMLRDLTENTVFAPRSYKKLEDTHPDAYDPIIMRGHGSRRRDFEEKFAQHAKKLPPEIDEDLSTIETSPDTQVIKILEWASQNLEHLENPTVQLRIRTFLFEYGRLEQAFEEAPEELLKLIRDFQKLTFTFYCDNAKQLPAFLWSVGIYQSLLQHIQLIPEATPLIRDIEWFDDRSILKTKLETTTNISDLTAIAQSLVNSFALEEEIGTENLQSIFKCYVLMSMAPSEINAHSLRIYSQHEPAIHRAITELPAEKLDQLANSIIKTYCGEDKPSRHWILADGKITNVEDEIDIILSTGKIFQHNSILIKQEELLKQNTLLRSLFSEDFDFSTITISGDEARTNDGKWIFKIKQEEDKIEVLETLHTINIDGHSTTYKLSKNLPESLATPLIEESEARCWIAVSSPSEIIIEHRRTKWAFIDGRTCDVDDGEGGKEEHYDDEYRPVELPGEKGKHYRYVDGQWSLLEYTEGNSFKVVSALANIYSPQTVLEKQWQQFTQKHAFTSLVHLDSTTEGCQSVSKIDFHTIGLSFVRREYAGKMRFFCEQHHGFYIDNLPFHQSMPPIQTMFTLTDGKGHHKVLIPGYGITETRKNLTTVNSTNILWKHFCYNIDSKKSLVAETPEGELYLAMLYRGLNDFKSAMRHLKASQHPNNNSPLEEHLFSELLETQKNLTPMSAAFDCHLAYRMLMQGDKWSEGSESFSISHEELLKKQYDRYHQAISSFKKGVCKIPHYLRVPDDVDETVKMALRGVDYYRTDLEDDSDCEDEPETTKARVRLTRFYKILELNPSESKQLSCYISNEYSRNRKECELTFEAQDEEKLIARPNFVRVFTSGETQKHAIETFLSVHFKELFMAAISEDPSIRQKLRIDLFFLARTSPAESAKNYDAFIRLLLDILKKPERFRDVSTEGSSEECLSALITKLKAIHYYSYERAEFVTDSDNERPHQIFHQVPRPHSLSAARLSFAMQPLSADSIRVCPLGEIATHCFVSEQQPIATKPFALEIPASITALEKRLLGHYAEGHATNQTTEITKYHPQAEVSLVQTKTLVQSQLDIDREKANTLMKDLLSLARKNPLDQETLTQEELSLALIQEVEHRGMQRQQINLDDIIYSLLKQKPSILAEKNCFLRSQERISKIYSLAMEYCLISSRIQQAKEALDTIGPCEDFTLLDKTTMQKLGGILHKKRSYDIVKYPEFVIYEYVTGNILRPKQVEVLQWIIENSETPDASHLLTQFSAGGGKTAVIIPLLAQRFARNGALPTIINTPELYKIGIGDIPMRLKDCFQQMMEIIEVKLDFYWHITNIDKLQKQLSQWQADQKCILIKATTWHSINIAYKTALNKGDIRHAKEIQSLLNFFKENTIMLNDEGHLVSDPLQESIVCSGRKEPIPKQQQELLIYFYDLLMEIPAAGIARHDKHELTPKQILTIQRRLAAIGVERDIFEGLAPSKLYTYLLQTSKKRPPWLEELHRTNPQQADLVVLARAFIKTLLPHIFKMQYKKNYGVSIHKGDLTAAPKHDGNNVSSHFGDPMLVAALTIQLTHKQGVDQKFLLKMLRSLRSMHIAERKWNRTRVTRAEKRLRKLLGREDINLSTVSQADLQAWSENKALQHHPYIKRTYLRIYALPQIQTPKYRISSTPAELHAGFSKSITFSATPGLLETYPVFMTKHWSEAPFEAEVIDTLLQEANSSLYTLPADGTATEFMRHLHATCPEEIEKMTALIDRGGILCHERPGSVAEAYLEHHHDRSALCFEGRCLSVRSALPGVGEIKITGSDIVRAARERGLTLDDLRMFLFLDLGKTTGTDVKQPITGRAALTVGKKQTMTETIQAAMRERQLLRGQGQSIFWLILQGLSKSINPEGVTSVKELFYWMIANEAQILSKKLMMRAYQGIQQIIEEELLKQESLSGVGEALEKQQQHSVFETYELVSEFLPTATTLRQYYIHLARRNELVLSPDAIERINKIIAQTEALIAKMQSPHGPELHQEVLQEQEHSHEYTMEEESEQEQEEELTIEKRDFYEYDYTFRPQPYSREDDGLDKLALLDEAHLNPDNQWLLKQDSRLRSLTKEMPPIIISQKFIGITRKDIHMKPIRHFLVQQAPDGKLLYFALSTTGLEFYRKEIRGSDLPEGYKYAIIGDGGHILYSSTNVDESDREALVNAPDVIQMINFISLLNGQLKDPRIIGEIARRYNWTRDDFSTIIQYIERGNASKHKIHIPWMTTIAKTAGWITDEEPLEDTGDEEIPILFSTKKLTAHSHRELPSHGYEAPPLPHRDPITSSEKGPTVIGLIKSLEENDKEQFNIQYIRARQLSISLEFLKELISIENVSFVYSVTREDWCKEYCREHADRMRTISLANLHIDFVEIIYPTTGSLKLPERTISVENMRRIIANHQTKINKVATTAGIIIGIASLALGILCSAITISIIAGIIIGGSIPLATTLLQRRNHRRFFETLSQKESYTSIDLIRFVNIANDYAISQLLQIVNLEQYRIIRDSINTRRLKQLLRHHEIQQNMIHNDQRLAIELHEVLA